MLLEVAQIQKWLRAKFGAEVPDGLYVIPVGSPATPMNVRIRDGLIHLEGPAAVRKAEPKGPDRKRTRSKAITSGQGGLTAASHSRILGRKRPD